MGRIALYRCKEGLTLAQKRDIKNGHLIKPSLAKAGIHIYLHKKNADKVPLIAAALREIKAEGLSARMCRKALAGFQPLPAQCETR